MAPAPDAAPAPSPQPATWPRWFGPVDYLLALLVLIVAFLAASYTARNSDLWLHLATGRLVANGHYTPGADSFSFASGDRVWADSTWLYSLSVYAFASADPSGATLVAVKAVLFAAAYGLLLLLRRPGQPLWPWATVAAVGIVASASFVSVRPIGVTLLFLAMTLVVLFRVPWRANSWREPAFLTVLFALWSNFDSWFLLGPLTVALVLVGEQLTGFTARRAVLPSDDPIPPAPPARGLGRALLLGTAACLLNPMVLAALVKDPVEASTQLVPWELGFHTPAGIEVDSDLDGLKAKPLQLFDDRPNTFLWFHPNQPDEELNIHAVAYFLLLGGMLLVLAVSSPRFRATHLLLGIVFGALSLIHVRLIPVFAMVAVPVAAISLNLLAQRISLSSWAETRTRVLLGGSIFGRLGLVLGALLLIGAAYPGWLHPRPNDKYHVNRVAWAIEPDPGLARAAKQLTRLRSQVGLPAELRGLWTSPAFGDYCAWSVPGEKSFMTSRYNFHRSELPDVLTLRALLGGRRTKEVTPHELSEIAGRCEKHRAEFLMVVSTFRSVDAPGVFELLESDSRWVLWHLDGRTAIVGRPPDANRAAFDQFRYDPVRLVFSRDMGTIPVDPVIPPPASRQDSWDGFLAAYQDRPKTPEPDIEDAVVLTQYQAYLTERAKRWSQHRIALAHVGGMVASPTAAGVWASLHADGPIDDARMVLPLLTVRSARRAIAATPDRPEAYVSLAIAYRQPFAPAFDVPLPVFEMSEKELHLVTAMARYLARVPSPEQATTSQAWLAVKELLQLGELYTRTRQLDFALMAYRKAMAYTRRLPASMLSLLNPEPGQPFTDAQAKEFLTKLEEQVDQRERGVDLARNRVLQQGRTPTMKFIRAAEMGLPALAIQIFHETDLKEFGVERDNVLVRTLILEMKAGLLEQAATQLAGLTEDIRKLTARDDKLADLFRTLLALRARLAGDIATAIAIQNQIPEQKLPPELVRLAITHPDVPPALMGGVGMPIFAAQFMGAKGYLVQEAGYQYDRAMLELLNGNPSEARRRLELAFKPKGIDLERFGGDPTGLILKYLELLRRYEASSH